MSKIEVDAIDKQSGSTLTLGGSGTAVTLACGATQSGFGRSGSVNWQTASIKTSTFTAANGEGYFVDTSSGGVTANLPAGSAGAIVAFSDYTRTFASNSLIISPNGSEKVGGLAAPVTLSINGQALTLVYVDGTEGWINVQNAEDTETGSAFVQATGGNTTATCGDFKIHTFTSPGTFQVTDGGQPGGSNTVEYLVVAGGGAGGGDLGGGGGAGGYRTVFPSPATGGLPVSVASYPVTVGAGGTAPTGPQPGAPITASGSGSNSVFTGSSTITSAGGGGGGQSQVPFGGGPGAAGGSGGGSSGYEPASTPGGAGNTPSVPVSQGNNGGAGGRNGPTYAGGGGGGAGAVGGSAPSNTAAGQAGGVGVQLNIDGNNYYWAGGGGGAAYQPAPKAGDGGLGGGGGGGKSGAPNCAGSGGGSAINAGSAGTGNNPETNGVQGGAGGTNSGGGGGAGAHNGTPGVQPNSNGGNGGSGIVIIRYKFQ